MRLPNFVHKKYGVSHFWKIKVFSYDYKYLINFFLFLKAALFGYFGKVRILPGSFTIFESFGQLIVNYNIFLYNVSFFSISKFLNLRNCFSLYARFFPTDFFLGYFLSCNFSTKRQSNDFFSQHFSRLDFFLKKNVKIFLFSFLFCFLLNFSLSFFFLIFLRLFSFRCNTLQKVNHGFSKLNTFLVKRFFSFKKPNAKKSVLRKKMLGKNEIRNFYKKSKFLHLIKVLFIKRDFIRLFLKSKIFLRKKYEYLRSFFFKEFIFLGTVLKPTLFFQRFSNVDYWFFSMTNSFRFFQITKFVNYFKNLGRNDQIFSNNFFLKFVRWDLIGFFFKKLNVLTAWNRYLFLINYNLEFLFRKNFNYNFTFYPNVINWFFLFFQSFLLFDNLIRTVIARRYNSSKFEKTLTILNLSTLIGDLLLFNNQIDLTIRLIKKRQRFFLKKLLNYTLKAFLLLKPTLQSIYLLLKGKILGRSRKRKLMLPMFNQKSFFFPIHDLTKSVHYSFKSINTFTGVFGLHTYVRYSVDLLDEQYYIK